jgi:hypothetical protein
MLNQQHDVNIFINEDSYTNVPVDISQHTLAPFNSSGIGQHKSIQFFLYGLTDKYYLHLEDDWLFDNSYDWISESVKIMEADPSIIKVLCRNGSPHPCTHDLVSESGLAYGIIEPWENDGIIWHGFSWNPGVTRLDLLKQFVPFGEREQNVAEAIHAAGYKVAELSIPIYTHIGEGRSTPR